MRKENIIEAQEEAERFVKLADYVYKELLEGDCSPKLTGALRRASMDLTRALAEMRRA
jgi:hypothetical protein